MAVPAIPFAAKIVSSIIMWMVEDRLSAAQAAGMAAREYDAYIRFTDGQIQELAIMLGGSTDIPYWDWFVILRHARDYRLFENGAGNGNGNGNGKGDKIPVALLWAIPAVLVVMLLAARR